MFTTKKAEVGIGTLIVFIAMILVAAIAASVLIQTATSLQNKALLAGDRTTGQVSTGMSVVSIYAEDGSTGNSVNNFTIKMKLASGSDPIKLNDTLVEFDLSDQSADLKYNGTAGCGTPGTFWSTAGGGEGYFAVDYLVEGQDYRNHYLSRGDIISVCIESPRAVVADEDVSIRIIPRVGTPLVIETATPEVVNQARAYIFP